jgi:aryl-alcohol dehydrogenase-like predicted oxidoreductase
MTFMESTEIAGKNVSRIGLGTWAIGGLEWGAVSDREAVATVLGALERGINLIDTAPIYGHGRSEEIVGQALRAHGRREDFFIASKTGLTWSSSGVFTDSTEARLRKELEDSLRRLGTDFIDLYQVHWPDPLVPIAETAALLEGFRCQGKVRALGVSNFSVAQMEAFRAVAPLASNQPPYNLFERSFAEGCCAHGESACGDGPGSKGKSILEFCRGNQIAVLTYSSLCRSLLGGRVQRGMIFDAKDIRSVDPKFQEPRFSQYMTAVEGLATLARERFGKSLLELAARWVLDRPGVSVALWGAKRPEQLDAVAGVMGWALDAEAMAEIDRIVAAAVTDPIGPEYLTPATRSLTA